MCSINILGLIIGNICIGIFDIKYLYMKIIIIIYLYYFFVKVYEFEDENLLIDYFDLF